MPIGELDVRAALAALMGGDTVDMTQYTPPVDMTRYPAPAGPVYDLPARPTTQADLGVTTRPAQSSPDMRRRWEARQATATPISPGEAALAGVPQPTWEQRAMADMLDMGASAAASADVVQMTRQLERYRQFKAKQTALAPEVAAVQDAMMHRLAQKAASGRSMGSAEAAGTIKEFDPIPGTGQQAYPINRPGLGPLSGEAEGPGQITFKANSEWPDREGPLLTPEMAGGRIAGDVLYGGGQVTGRGLRGLDPNDLGEALSIAQKTLLHKEKTRKSAAELEAWMRRQADGGVIGSGIATDDGRVVMLPGDIVDEAGRSVGGYTGSAVRVPSPSPGDTPDPRLHYPAQQPDMPDPYISDALEQGRLLGYDQDQAAQALIRALGQRGQPTWY